jgi:AraC-like DNA-binding protein
MSDLGILYTEHSGLAAMSPIASLWSYETRVREPRRPAVSTNSDGSHEYWLDRSDPLLNTILPSTHVSLIINGGDVWASGRSLTTSSLLPRVCIAGPITQSRILRLGRSVTAIGAVVAPVLSVDMFGMPASELVDRIVPLEDVWTRDEVDALLADVSVLDVKRGLSRLKAELVAGIARTNDRTSVAVAAFRLIRRHGGRVAIDEMAKGYGLTRQQFARQFSAAAGLSPKLFARITRFNSLVHALLSSDVSDWAGASTDIGFYDQAHMINEFREFAGLPPTVFFRPHDSSVDPGRVQLRGRPSEWLRPAEPVAGNRITTE